MVFQEEGKASFYGDELAGQKTASGAKFDPDAMTAAHPTLPLGTRGDRDRPATAKQVEVEVNDRGPTPRDGTSICQGCRGEARASPSRASPR